MVIRAILFLVLVTVGFADILPAANRIVWTPNDAAGAGVPGGIPTYSGTTYNVTSAPYSATGNGTTDDTTAIQAAIDAASTGDIVYFPAGTYKTTAQLNVTNKGIILRGAMTALTTWASKIIRDSASSGSVIKISRTSSLGSAQSITGGNTKGSTSVSVTDATTIATGDFIYVYQTNDPAISTNGGATWVGVNQDETKVLHQIVKVTNKVSNTLTISPALYYAYDTATYGAAVMEIALMTGAGVEDLWLEQAQTTSDKNASHGVFMVNATGCWVKNVKTRSMHGAAVCMEHSFQCEVRHCDIGPSGLSNASGCNYGAWTFMDGGNHLITDNIFVEARHSMISEGGGTGNVYFANFCADDWGAEDSVFLHGSNDTHGAQALAALWEANVTGKATHDNTWGSSGYLNTWFRNWVTISGYNLTFTRGLAGIDFQANSYGNAVIVCVIGKSGQSGTVYATNGQATTTRRAFRLGFSAPGAGDVLSDAAVGTTTVVSETYTYQGAAKEDLNAAGLDDPTSTASLAYPGGAPSFWGTCPWPAFDPDAPGSAAITNIPAGYRYINNAEPDSLPTTPSHSRRGSGSAARGGF